MTAPREQEGLAFPASSTAMCRLVAPKEIALVDVAHAFFSSRDETVTSATTGAVASAGRYCESYTKTDHLWVVAIHSGTRQLFVLLDRRVQSLEDAQCACAVLPAVDPRIACLKVAAR